MQELRKLVFGLCCSLGGLAGLWWAIATTPEQPQGEHALEQLGGVTGPVLLHFGAGFTAGVAIGLISCLAVLKPR